MPVTEQQLTRWQDFVDAVVGRRLALAKLSDRGFTRVVQRGNKVVSQPSVEFVATAFDPAGRVLYRWEEVVDAKDSVIVDEPRPGHVPAATLVHKKDRLRAALEARGVMVSDGKWTVADLEAALADGISGANGRPHDSRRSRRQ